MSDKYEWEEAQGDDTKAKAGMGTLAIGVLGIAAKLFYDHSQKQSKKQIQEQIDRKTDQYRTLEAKWFKSSAEKEEIARLKEEIDDLKKLL